MSTDAERGAAPAAPATGRAPARRNQAGGRRVRAVIAARSIPAAARPRARAGAGRSGAPRSISSGLKYSLHRYRRRTDRRLAGGQQPRGASAAATASTVGATQMR